MVSSDIVSNLKPLLAWQSAKVTTSWPSQSSWTTLHKENQVTLRINVTHQEVKEAKGSKMRHHSNSLAHSLIKWAILELKVPINWDLTNSQQLHLPVNSTANSKCMGRICRECLQDLPLKWITTVTLWCHSMVVLLVNMEHPRISVWCHQVCMDSSLPYLQELRICSQWACHPNRCMVVLHNKLINHGCRIKCPCQVISAVHPQSLKCSSSQLCHQQLCKPSQPQMSNLLCKSLSKYWGNLCYRSNKHPRLCNRKWSKLSCKNSLNYKQWSQRCQASKAWVWKWKSRKSIDSIRTS